MDTTQLPKSYKDLPTINVFGAGYSGKSKSMWAVAILYIFAVCIYTLPTFNNPYGQFAPNAYIRFDVLYDFFRGFGEDYTVAIFTMWFPFIISLIGAFTFLFSRRVNIKKWLSLNIISFLSLLVWDMRVQFRWYQAFYEGPREYWWLLCLFALAGTVCFIKFRKTTKNT